MNYKEDFCESVVENDNIKFQFLSILCIVFVTSLAWYFLLSACISDFLSGNQVRWSLAIPFLAHLSFYIYRDFYRLIVK